MPLYQISGGIVIGIVRLRGGAGVSWGVVIVEAGAMLLEGSTVNTFLIDMGRTLLLIRSTMSTGLMFVRSTLHTVAVNLMMVAIYSSGSVQRVTAFKSITVTVIEVLTMGELIVLVEDEDDSDDEDDNDGDKNNH